MDDLIQDIFKKINQLNLTYLDEQKTLKIINIAFNSVISYLNLNFNPFFDFNSIKSIIIDISIGEYLNLLLNSNLYDNLQIEEAIKTISEGDTSLTYFQQFSQQDRVRYLATYFLDKRKLIEGFKSINW